MINLIHAELYQLRKSFLLKVCYLVVIACSIVYAVLAHQVAMGDTSMVGNAGGVSDIFILSVIGPMLAGIIVCNDFESKNLHDAITRGRKAIVGSKIVVFTLLMMLMVMPYAVTALIGFVSKGEFSSDMFISTYINIISNSGNYDVNAAGTGKVICILLVSLLCYASRMSFCIPLAFKVRKSVIVTVVGVIFGFLIDLILSGAGKITGVDRITDLLPFTHTFLSMDMTWGEIGKVAVVSIVFIILMGALTYRMFKRAEIK